MSTIGSRLLTKINHPTTAMVNHIAGIQNNKRIAIPKRLIIHLLYLLLTTPLPY